MTPPTQALAEELIERLEAFDEQVDDEDMSYDEMYDNIRFMLDEVISRLGKMS